MSKPKMAKSLRRILVLATVVSVIMFADHSEAQESDHGGSGHGGSGGSGGSPGVLPTPDATPGESGMVDANNRAVTQGLIGLISPIFWPATYSALNLFDFILRVFVGQKLPCTLWSVAPPRMKCTMLE